MANEYIFFAADLRDRFIRFAAAQGIAGSMREDEIEGFVVALPDDLDDGTDAAIEAEYEALMDEQMAMVESNEVADARDVMGVTVTLPDGRSCVVRLPAAIARRLFENFAVGEIHELVSTIAQSVLNPVEGPLCRDV